MASTAMLAPLLLLVLAALASSRTANKATADHHDSALQSGSLGSALSPLVFDPNDIKFHLYTKRNDSDVQGTIVTSDKASILRAGWKKNNDVRVLIHDCGDNIESPMIQNTKNAYLATNSKLNVIGVDWSKLCLALLDIITVADAKPTGQRVGEFISALISEGLSEPMRIFFVGHGLGALVCGFAAREADLGLGKPPLLIAADPANPLFGSNRCEDRLCDTDARNVIVLQTSSSGAMDLGNKNLQFFKGLVQPGCAPLDGACAHRKAYEYFDESIKNPKAFSCEFCTSPENAFIGNCDSNDIVFLGDGQNFVSAKNGTYYCYRSSSPPSA